MTTLNYKHLHYFWAVAKAGGVTRAAERLHLTPQSISGQLKVLEESLGGDLFTRVGRKLELTEAGRVALAYAEEIFPRGEELQDALNIAEAACPSCCGSASPMSCRNQSRSGCSSLSVANS